jgi:uncharacterized alpha-E superfamily protein
VEAMLSRVADNLYWMSRYLERAEHTARQVDVHLNLILEHSRQGSQTERWGRLMRALYVPFPEGRIQNEYDATRRLVFDSSNANSIVTCVANARENARQVREKISSEMWMQVNRLYLDVRRTTIETIWHEQPHEFFMAVKNGAHLFQGITDSTMVHDEGWQFIQLGRFIERTMGTATVLDEHLAVFPLSSQTSPADDYFEWLGLLKCFTAFEAYCKVYNADLQPPRIIEFLMFNPDFPHSARFCVEMMQAALEDIARVTSVSKNSRVYRLVGRLRSSLSYDQVDEIMTRGAHHYLQGVVEQCMMIHDAIYETYITYSIETAW